MNFGGLQKLTLLDFPGKVACTVFTKGCNFLCPFCHNSLLVNKTQEAMDYSEEEILSFLRKRQGILEGVCITGGEPLLHPGITDFIRRVKELGFLVKLDTNGTFPGRLKTLVEEGLLDYVAMDIKNSKEKYAVTAGLSSLDLSAIEESIAFLLSGKVAFEFRTTVVKELHEPQDMEAIARWISGAPRYFLQGFVDSGDLICPGFSAHSVDTMAQMRSLCLPYVPQTEVRGS